MANMPIQQKPYQFERIEPFLGVDYSVSPNQIDKHRSPDMKNFIVGTSGDLVKRTGYKRIYPFSLGEGGINGMYHYQKVNGDSIFLFAHGTNLYSYPVVSPINITSGAVDLGLDGTLRLQPIATLSNHDVHFFTFKDLCYIMDGTNFLVYDGTTVSELEPYIPILTISNTPTGGGTSLEDWNLIGRGFTEKFSSDGTATVYQLSQKDLDADTVQVKVDTVDKVEGTDFTVDRTTGKVTFNSAPASGTNNVEITAYKTIADKPNMIKNCTFSTLFGGANDTRIFISGNPNMPTYIWRSGLDDPTYWPENGFYKREQEVKGFSKQYDYLIVEMDGKKGVIDFQLNGGEVSFPYRPINDQIGTLANKSIQLLDNNPVSLSETGVYMLVASNIRTERNVQHISERVDKKLLAEPNLESAISIDYDRKYWLAVNGNVYVYDYSIGEWYLLDNIQASCFLEIDGYLYFGSATEGIIYRFMKESESRPYHDDGTPIQAYWTSKRLSFTADEYRKLVEQVFVSLKPLSKTSCAMYYVTDQHHRTLVNIENVNLFSYAYLDYSSFSYSTNAFPQELQEKIKAKKIVYFQLELRNENLYEGMGVNSIGIKYYYQSLVK